MRAFEEAMKHDATDEEAKRSFYLSKIRWWVNTAMDDLVYLHGRSSSMVSGPSDILRILDELRVLLQRQAMEPTTEQEQHRRAGPPPGSRPLKPLIITRDMLQAKVFGTGYPSGSTMTIDEFYESLARRGLAPTPEQAKEMAAGQCTALRCVANDCRVSGPKFPSASDMEKEEVAKEAHVDKDDPDMIRYLRSKDDFKDEHRRGEGNRHNRS